MERHFDEELNDLKQNILKMAMLVDEAIGKAIKALKNRDSALAEKVVEEDNNIDMLEIHVDKECLDLIARRQPIAVDLRFVTSIMKINSDLERIGDLAVSVAQRALSVNKLKPLKPLIDIPKMGEMTQAMLRDAMTALVDKNTLMARKICEIDVSVDKLYVQNFREVLTYMMEDANNIKVGIHLILASKQLERMADHVTNIAEEVVYMVEAKTIKHHYEEKDETEE